MIIGDGLIANAFADYHTNNRVIIFASGVSNSLQTKRKEFNREKKFLNEALDFVSTIVYFSSTICYDKNKEKYINHKRKMENLIFKKSKQLLIIRLPQIIGNGGNENTLINFIVNKIKNDEEINVYDGVERSLVDVDDLKHIVDYILNKKITGMFTLNHIELVKIEDLVRLISKHLKKEAKIKLVPGEKFPMYDNDPIINEALDNLNIKSTDYTKKLIKKYIK